jgi:hypothetical protein
LKAFTSVAWDSSGQWKSVKEKRVKELSFLLFKRKSLDWASTLALDNVRQIQTEILHMGY